MEERIGFVGMVIEDKQSVPKVNEILATYGKMIRGRLGLPDPENGVNVITLVVYADSDQVGALTGKLGNLKGVKVKSALTAPLHQEKEIQ